MIWVLLALVIPQTLAQITAKAEPCVYVNTMFKTEERRLEAATPTDCEKLCRTMNPNSAGDGVRCLSWNMDKLKESCKVNVTIPTVEPNTYYGITNCTKPGSPSGNAPTCTMLFGMGSIMDGNAMIWGPEERYTLCKARCDSNKNCLAWQFIASNAWTSCRFYEWKVRPDQYFTSGVGFCNKEYISKGSSLVDLGAPWWCTFWGSKCGPNCCSTGNCCEGPNVCASGETCQELKCQHEGGQVCGGNCCKGNTPMCCMNADGLNVCVESDALCQQYNCQSKGGLTCGKQCCSANSTCCTGLNTETCVKTLTDCVALECLEEGGIACGDSCCGGGTFCCNGKCMTDIQDCLAEQCLQVGGQFCGKSCCRQQTTTPLCCAESRTCVQDGTECQQVGCENWCHNAGECCNNPYYVCCNKESAMACAANPLFCRNDLAEFAVGFAQRKTK